MTRGDEDPVTIRRISAASVRRILAAAAHFRSSGGRSEERPVDPAAARCGGHGSRGGGRAWLWLEAAGAGCKPFWFCGSRPHAVYLQHRLPHFRAAQKSFAKFL